MVPNGGDVERIFISYVREDTAPDANALYQSLEREFGADAIFKDVDDLRLGVNWRTAVEEAVDCSSALLCVIGPDWTASDAVLLELARALEREIPIIPVLVRGADIRALTENLDTPIDAIRYLNGAVLRHESWGRDLEPLVGEIKSLGLRARSAADTSATDSGGRGTSEGRADAVTIKVLEEALTGARLTIGLPQSRHHVRVIQGLWKAKLEIDGRRTEFVERGVEWVEFDIEAPDATYRIELQSTDRLTKLEIVGARVNGRDVELLR